MRAAVCAVVAAIGLVAQPAFAQADRTAATFWKTVQAACDTAAAKPVSELGQRIARTAINEFNSFGGHQIDWAQPVRHAQFLEQPDDAKSTAFAIYGEHRRTSPDPASAVGSQAKGRDATLDGSRAACSIPGDRRYPPSVID